jgi:hypothetical protein
MEGIVYAIKCKTTNEIYYGSTFDYQQRQRLHKCSKRNLCKSKQIINRNNYDFILLGKFPNITQNELCKIEQYYIDNNDCINKSTAYSYDRNNLDKKEYHKLWSKNNKDKIKKNRETFNNNLTDEEYKKLLEYKKQHYNNTKEKQMEQQRQRRKTAKLICEFLEQFK